MFHDYKVTKDKDFYAVEISLHDFVTACCIVCSHTDIWQQAKHYCHCITDQQQLCLNSLFIPSSCFVKIPGAPCVRVHETSYWLSQRLWCRGIKTGTILTLLIYSSSSPTVTPTTLAQPKSVSPLPTAESKEQQGEQVGSQQDYVKVPTQEEPFWQEAPVDRPLEQKLTSKIKCPAQITNGILQEERHTQQNLWYRDRYI